ncbi:MAG TPA: hypothetical protein VD948_10600 [Rhodothermales bacterium]|nr:hypothetical protein [Rhodothermales bacterium]
MSDATQTNAGHSREETEPQPLDQGYGNDTGYAQQPASGSLDPTEPSPEPSDDGDDAQPA